MLILFNGQIKTLDERVPHASSIAIEGGRIRWVSPDNSVTTSARSEDQLFDLEGQTVWPGLTDAHLHLEHYALALQRIDCETSTRAECITRVSERVKTIPSGVWVRGHGWNQNSWSEGFGCAGDLDAVAPDHPVFLTAKSLHAAWANSIALRLAGITATTSDPPGGMIQRDSSGQPTGILLESAMDLITAILPMPTMDDMCQALLIAQQNLWKMGITSVHDFDRQRCSMALQRLHERGQLRLRVIKSLPVENLAAAIELGLRSGFGDDYLKIGSVKCFTDGALGPQTAAMLQPYEGSQSNTGLLLLNADQVFEIGVKAAQAGLSLAIHAIGDRANREVLDGYSRLRQHERQNHLPPLRHRIEHVQIIDPADQNRLVELGIIASVQPIHATSDMHMADHHWGSRSAGAYAYRTLLESGAVLAFGSDAPVESPNPFWGLHAAVTRQDRNGQPNPEGWYPKQKLNLQQALNGFTTGPAHAANRENQQGKLAPGYFADLIVLSEDPFTMPPQTLHQVTPSATMVGGQWVWQSKMEG